MKSKVPKTARAGAGRQAAAKGRAVERKPARPAIKPLSVRLTASEIEQMRRIAAQLRISEHAVRHFAIQRFLADWQRGWRPKSKAVTTQILVP
jgi:hypothetical protein